MNEYDKECLIYLWFIIGIGISTEVHEIDIKEENDQKKEDDEFKDLTQYNGIENGVI